MRSPATYTYTIPSCLKEGFYLVRHEIIALHAAWIYPGAQFYPGCHQLNVTAGGSTVPSANLVSFPGAYKPTDPGVTYDAYKSEDSNSQQLHEDMSADHSQLKLILYRGLPSSLANSKPL